mmetsp:Transcript_164699/g.528383  ORF Transcript_164699/g.528383 Transcript_164699/m.528383 type:complete len:235 (-) Transcript_164699:1038-1742(-)
MRQGVGEPAARERRADAYATGNAQVHLQLQGPQGGGSVKHIRDQAHADGGQGQEEQVCNFEGGEHYDPDQEQQRQPAPLRVHASAVPRRHGCRHGGEEGEVALGLRMVGEFQEGFHQQDIADLQRPGELGRRPRRRQLRAAPGPAHRQALGARQPGEGEAEADERGAGPDAGLEQASAMALGPQDLQRVHALQVKAWVSAAHQCNSRSRGCKTEFIPFRHRQLDGSGARQQRSS